MNSTAGSEHRDEAEPEWLLPVAMATMVIMGLGLLSLNSRSIWLDESITAGLGRGSWSSWWRGVAEDGGSQSLYFLAVRLSTFLGNEPWAIRLPSVVAAAAVPYPMYRLAAPRFGARVATFGVFILAVSYSFITNAQEARSYTMLALLITWSWLLMDRALQSDGSLAWVRWGVVAALTLYAQPLGLPILMAQGIWLVANRHRLDIVNVAAGVGAAAAVSVPFVYLTMFEAGDHTSWLGTFRLRAFAELVAAAFGAQRVSDALLLSAAGTLVAVALALVGAFPFGRRSSYVENNLLYLLWVAVPIVVLLVGSIGRAFMIARYAVPLVPATATLAAVGIERISQIDRRAGHGIAAALLGLLLARTVTGYGIEAVAWEGVEEFVADRASPDDVIAFEPAYTQAPFEYYTWLRGDVDRMARPMAPALGWTAPRHPNLEEYPLSPLPPPNGALWVVVRIDEGRVPDIVARFGVPMIETDRTDFGEASVLRFVVDPEQ